MPVATPRPRQSPSDGVHGAASPSLSGVWRAPISGLVAVSALVAAALLLALSERLLVDLRVALRPGVLGLLARRIRRALVVVVVGRLIWISFHARQVPGGSGRTPVTEPDPGSIGRMKTVAILTLVAALALGAGCGDDAAAPTTPPAGDGSLVTYSREGGVASMPIELTIQADGPATLVSGYDGQTEDFVLDDSELEELASELEAADLEGFEGPTEPTGCADCFLYTVSYEGTTISYDDTATPPDEVTALVNHLDELATAHTPSPA